MLFISKRFNDKNNNKIVKKLVNDIDNTCDCEGLKGLK